MTDELRIGGATGFTMVPSHVAMSCGVGRVCTHTDLAVWVAIAARAWAGAPSFPSYATIATDAGVSPRTVPRSVDRLVAAKLLSKQRRWRRGDHVSIGAPGDGTGWSETSGIFTVWMTPADVADPPGGYAPQRRGGTPHSVGGVRPTAYLNKTNEEDNLKQEGRASAETGTPPLFDEWWEKYPRKIGKRAAERAWRAAVKRVDPETILVGLDAQLAVFAQTDPQFVPHPSTWLNGDRWGDTPNVPRSSGRLRQREVDGESSVAVVDGEW